mgnify:CR=1 FL=1
MMCHFYIKTARKGRLDIRIFECSIRYNSFSHTAKGFIHRSFWTMLPCHCLYFIQHGTCTNADPSHETHTAFSTPVFHNLQRIAILLSFKKAAVYNNIQVHLYSCTLSFLLPLQKKAEKMGRQRIKISGKLSTMVSKDCS